MPKKRSEPSILEMAFTGRWPLAAALCFLFLIVGVWLGPAILATTTVFRPLASLIRTFACVPVIAFGLIAAVKFFRESNAVSAVRPHNRNSLPERIVEHERSWFAGTVDEPVRLQRTEPFVSSLPNAWSLELLQSIEWKRFEEVVAAYFREKNFRCETIEFGPDGGIDARLYFGDLPAPVGIVQCKAWGRKQVGVAPVRELLGVMAHEKVTRGYFCATGEFTAEASTFAASNPIKLISGRELLHAITQMPEDTRNRLLDVSTIGDYKTPTCPSCGIKLVKKAIGGRAAWACRNYPRCRVKIWIRKDDISSGIGSS